MEQQILKFTSRKHPVLGNEYRIEPVGDGYIAERIPSLPQLFGVLYMYLQEERSDEPKPYKPQFIVEKSGDGWPEEIQAAVRIIVDMHNDMVNSLELLVGEEVE